MESKIKNKKFILSGVVALILVLTMLLFVGCGGNNDNLTKTQFSEAFDAVLTTLDASNQPSSLIALKSANVDYETTNLDTTWAKNIMEFVKGVNDSESFNYTSDIIVGDIQDVDGYGTNVALKMDYRYQNEQIVGKYLIADNLQQPTFAQYLSYTIEYDFDNKQLNAFTIDFGMATFNSGVSSVENTNFLEYNTTDGLMSIVEGSETEQQKLAQLSSDLSSYLTAHYVESDVDFTSIYKEIMNI